MGLESAQRGARGEQEDARVLPVASSATIVATVLTSGFSKKAHSSRRAGSEPSSVGCDCLR
jgi:hypothetical protein